MWAKIKTYLEMTPDETFHTFKDKILSLENKKTCKRIFITAILTCLFNYFYFMVNGYNGPDGFIEGVYYYIGQNTANLHARWMIPIINTIWGKNIIIPLVIILFYSLMIAVASFFLFDLWDIKNAGFQILSVSAMICFPVVTIQFAYLYMALAYSVSFLAVALAAWFLKKKRISCFVAATFCLTIMFGSFQAYVGAAAAIAVIGFIVDIVSKKNILKSLEDFFQYIISGIIAGVLNLVIANIVMHVNGLTASERIAEVSISEVIKNLGFSLPASYKWFFSFFDTTVLSRNRLYVLLFATIIILAIINMIVLLKEKKPVHSLLLFVSILLLPLAMNACVVIFPHNGIYDVMRYQYVLLIPLAFALIIPLSKSIITSLTQWILYFTVFLLIVGYTISSNASAICYKLVYDSTHDQTVSMLSRVYELDGYDPDSTPIMFGGQTITYSDTYIAFEPLFRYSTIGAGPIFWGGTYGLTTSRYFFFRNCMGVDPYGLSQDEYWYVVGTQEYFEMPCWPAEGSVQMIDGYAVIKLADY